MYTKWPACLPLAEVCVPRMFDDVGHALLLAKVPCCLRVSRVFGCFTFTTATKSDCSFVLCDWQLWDLSAGKQLSEFRGHTASVTVVEFHPDEFFLASGSMDRSLLLTACVLYSVMNK